MDASLKRANLLLDKRKKNFRYYERVAMDSTGIGSRDLGIKIPEESIVEYMKMYGFDQTRKINKVSRFFGKDKKRERRRG